jgi:methionine-rich copper-binding protein CopC
MNRHIILAFTAIAGLAAPAFGHAFLQHATPGAGDALTRAPRQISLEFSEPLNAAFSGLTVTDGAGKDVTAAAPAVDGAALKVALKPLAPGVYSVAWHAVSVDTHRTEGAYRFTVKP